jgi:hypothetical protein
VIYNGLVLLSVSVFSSSKTQAAVPSHRRYWGDIILENGWERL